MICLKSIEAFDLLHNFERFMNTFETQISKIVQISEKFLQIFHWHVQHFFSDLPKIHQKHQTPKINNICSLC